MTKLMIKNRIFFAVVLFAVRAFSVNDSSARDVLVIGEGHDRIISEAGCFLLSEGSLKFSSPTWEDHSNLDALTIDPSSPTADIKGCFSADTQIDQFFSEIYDARALFNKGIDSDEKTKPLLANIFGLLKPGGKFEFQYDPIFEVTGVDDLLRESPSQLSFCLDFVGWTGPMRSWAKWMANPKAWWEKGRYELAEDTVITWDDASKKPVIKVDKEQKDVRFIGSQIAVFLFQYWGYAKFSPYIVSSTRQTLERATNMRFNNVEKILLQDAGFINVEMLIQKSPRTHRLERIVRAYKPLASL